MASIEEIAATLRNVATPGLKPKEIRSAIREKHPEATKREIVRAAFYALADAPAASEDGLAHLHDFALSERGADEDADVIVKVGKRRKNKRSSDAAGKPKTH